MNENKSDRRRLAIFMSDVLKVGSMHGFRYIDMYLRGREEFVVNIPNEPTRSPSFASPPTSPHSTADAFSLGSSYGSGNLASQFAEMNALPPASPNDVNIVQDPNRTMFLLACYTRYNRPLVWARTNEDRLKLILGSLKIDKDNPLSLKSTTLWKDKDIKIWEILLELVRVNCHPAPSNPFAVDWEYLESLSLQERILNTASLINLLQRIIQQDTNDRSFSARVLEDMTKLNKKHFEDLHTLIHQGGLPILEKAKKITNADTMTQRYPQGNKYRY